MSVLITKMNGDQEPFNRKKLERSLRRAGAHDEIRERIIEHIEAELREGITTEEIYRHAFERLRIEEQRPVAARYSVKRAVLDLGPSGYPFETFVGGIFRALGYTDVRTGVAMQGKCAPHEVDLTATYEKRSVIAEIKFHNSLGTKTDLKVALYVRARFDDLKKNTVPLDEGWLITNTRFTRNAARFGQCSGLRLLGWDYPRGRGLEVLIDEAGVHPLTALTTLTQQQKRQFLDDSIVLCREIDLSSESLRRYQVAEDRHDEVRDEVKRLCAIGKRAQEEKEST